MLLALLIGQGLCLLAQGKGAAQMKRPYQDHVDAPFRRAPMADSSRSIVTRIGENSYWAFDAELFRTHTVWKGGPLQLWGPPYSQQKEKFIADYQGKKIWASPSLFPWFTSGLSLGASPTNRMPSASFWAVGPRNRGKPLDVTMSYHLPSPSGTNVYVLENATANDENQLIRRFSVHPSEFPLHYLVSEDASKFLINGNVCDTPWGKVRLKVQKGAVEWKLAQSEVPYQEPILTEAATETTNTFKVHPAGLHRAFLQIEPSSEVTWFELILDIPDPGGVVITKGKSQQSSAPKKVHFLQQPKVQTLDPHLQIEHFQLPREAELLVTGMAWKNSNLLLSTWVGAIYELSLPPKGQLTATKIASGLNEPLGLLTVGNDIYVVQKGELTLIKTDPSSEYISYRCITDRWGYSGNYHSYSFGPVQTGPNKLFIATAGQRSRWDMVYGGWGFEVNLNTREITPICSGLRAPNGFGTYKDDLFVVDNQGNWIGACRLNHIQKGAFYGFPSSSPAPKEFVPDASKVKPPAVWFPRKLAPSASGFATIPEGAFGPFAGQMLAGDFQNAVVMRVQLEKVRGEWQGTVWPFAKGFHSGVNRLSFGPDKKLYVGGLRRTWAAAAPQEASLDRVSFTGQVPFEVLEVKSRANGFELLFTEDFDPSSVQDPENYLVTQFTYKYHKEYGSPEFDHNGKADSATELPIQSVHILDSRRIHVELANLRENYVTAFHLSGLRSKTGKDLWHDTFYYTLNQRGD